MQILLIRVWLPLTTKILLEEKVIVKFFVYYKFINDVTINSSILNHLTMVDGILRTNPSVWNKGSVHRRAVLIDG